MYSIKRKAAIISLLEQQKEVEVNSLSERFGISKETIRRDLSGLEREGVLTRTHGGAVYNGPDWREGRTEYPVSVRAAQRYNEKNAICKQAARELRDGEVIFVDNSSTTMYLPRHIPKDLHLTVITNSMKLLLEAAKLQNPRIQYTCFGGIFRESNLSFYGNATLRGAGEYFPDKTFLSCTGINRDGVVTDASAQEVDVKRLMLRQSQKVFLLADHTKFHKTGQIYLTDLSQSTVITDAAATGEDREFLCAFARHVIVVPRKGDMEG